LANAEILLVNSVIAYPILYLSDLSIIYGNELYKSMKANFEKLGGVVVSDGIGYRPYTGQFAASL
jgi:hypothetical protein